MKNNRTPTNKQWLIAIIAIITGLHFFGVYIQDQERSELRNAIAVEVDSIDDMNPLFNLFLEQKVNVTVRNTTDDVIYSDIRFTCEGVSETGTALVSKRKTLHRFVRPHSGVQTSVDMRLNNPEITDVICYATQAESQRVPIAPEAEPISDEYYVSEDEQLAAFLSNLIGEL